MYADDHTLINRSPLGAQHALDLASEWLFWTRSMRAKPRKCKSLGLSLSALSFRKDHNAPYYSPFDPGLTISGDSIQYLRYDPFKFLGQIIFTNLSDSAQRKALLDDFNNYMLTVDTLQLKGASKAWLFCHYVISFISLPFIIYDFPPSCADKITAVSTRYLKQWLGIHRNASPEILYIPSPGLGFKNPKVQLKSMQLVKYMLLKNSDDHVANFVAHRQYEKATNDKSRRWHPELVVHDLETELKWNNSFNRGVQGKSGLSVKPKAQQYQLAHKKEKRKLILTRFKETETERMRVRLIDLCRGGHLLTIQ